MIRAYTGRLGAGKTYSMVADARKLFMDGYPQVFTSMASLKFPGSIYFPIERIGEIATLERGIILLDEAHVSMGSRTWNSTPKEALVALSQLRKNGLHLFFTTQHLDKVDKQLRELVNEVSDVSNVLGRLTICRTLDPNVFDSRERKKPLRTRWFIRDERIYCLYDTMEKLSTQELDESKRCKWLEAVASQATEGSAKQPRQAFTLDPVPPGSTVIPFTAETLRVYLQLGGRDLQERAPGVWAAILRSAVIRDRWLRLFGLDPAVVPASVTYENPWAEGCFPEPALAPPPVPAGVSRDGRTLDSTDGTGNTRRRVRGTHPHVLTGGWNS